jgi:hypothetical protein
MNSLQHVQAKTLREFLRDELQSPDKIAVGLHLSYCPICQEQQEEMLLEEANYEMCGLGDRPFVQATEHIAPQVFVDFWQGAIRDRGRLEELSEHCLLCEECRSRRYDIWSDNRGLIQRRRYAAIVLTLLAGVAERASRARRRVTRNVLLVGGGTAIVASLALVVVGVVLLKNISFSDALIGAIPPVQIEHFWAVPNLHNPPAVVVPETAAPDRPIQKSTSSKGPTRRRVLPVVTKDVGKLWEEIAQLQRFTLKKPSEEEVVRGADENPKADESPQAIVISRKRDTAIYIQLPEESKNGKYLVSIFEPGHLDPDNGLAKDETVSLDGKELAVWLNLKSLVPGNYVLLVERENGSDARDYIGYFPVLVIDPSREKAE